jgi:adenosylmethionine-8-amino-7-oxononanoate aminotransferase
MKALFHGHSYTGNPLCIAASLASLDLFEQEKTLIAIEKITTLQKDFIKEISSHPKVANARSIGTIAAFEFVADESGNNYFSSVRDKLYEFFISQKIILRPLGNTVYIMPPYCITEEQLKKIYKCIIDAFQKI